MKVLIIFVMIFVIYRVLKKMILEPMKSDTPPYPLERSRGDSADDLMIKDPECGVYFPQRQGVSLKVNGETLTFCSDKCRDDYKAKNPGNSR